MRRLLALALFLGVTTTLVAQTATPRQASVPAFGVSLYWSGEEKTADGVTVIKNLSLTYGNMTITGDAISVPGTADASGFEFVSKARVTFKR